MGDRAALQPGDQNAHMQHPLGGPPARWAEAGILHPASPVDRRRFRRDQKQPVCHAQGRDHQSHRPQALLLQRRVSRRRPRPKHPTLRPGRGRWTAVGLQRKSGHEGPTDTRDSSRSQSGSRGNARCRAGRAPCRLKRGNGSSGKGGARGLRSRRGSSSILTRGQLGWAE